MLLFDGGRDQRFLPDLASVAGGVDRHNRVQVEPWVRKETAAASGGR